jgi:chromosome partitioning protein
MTILAVINQKGGAAKTTLCTNLAVEFIQRGYSVCIIDTDPQGTASRWNAMRADEAQLMVMKIEEAKLIVSSANTQSKLFDLVLIDGVPSVKEPMAASIKAADAVLIPCQPSLKDLWSTTGVVDVIHARHTVTDGVPAAAFVVTKAKRGTKFSKQIDETLLQLGLPVFDTHIHDLEAFKTIDLSGEGVVEMEPRGTAAKEIRALVDELITNKFIGARDEVAG